MARSRRSRRGGRPWQRGGDDGWSGDEDRDDFAHLRSTMRRTEERRGASWTVQPITPERAVKSYVCPGCNRGIEPGTAHVAVWRADFVLGDDHALEGRRHWHTHCWRIA